MKKLLLLLLCVPLIGLGQDKEPESMKGMLDAHNEYTSELGIPSLVWCNKLAKSSESWANKLKRRGCEMEHDPNSKYGENLAWNSGYNETPKGVVDRWCGEKKYFNYKTKKYNSRAGHYTQVIWRETKKVGGALVQCGKEQIWVCRYDPPGNWVNSPAY